MIRKYTDLSGEKIWVRDSASWECSDYLMLGEINNNGNNQIVYKTRLQEKELVLKILIHGKQYKYEFWVNTEFTAIEFYAQCLHAIKKSWVSMPDYFDVLNLNLELKDNTLAFLQTYIPGGLFDDLSQLPLPDLWLIENWIAKWKNTSVQDTFYSEELDRLIFLDWDHYLLRLKRIAEKVWIKTYDDLKKNIKARLLIFSSSSTSLSSPAFATAIKYCFGFFIAAFFTFFFFGATFKEAI